MIIQYIVIFSGFLGVFLSIIFLVHTRGNKQANRLLAILLIILTLQLVKYVNFGFELLSPSLTLLASVLIFLLGPIFLFYTRSLFGRNLSNRPIYIHFIPVFIALIIMISGFVYVLIIGKEDVMIHRQLLSTFFLVYIMLQIIHMLIYNLKSFTVINDQLNSLKDSYSNLKKINGRWLKHASVGFTIIILLSFVFYLLLLTGGYYELNYETDLGFIIAISLLVNYVGFRALTQPEIISGEWELSKYSKSKLNPEDVSEYKHRISNFMELNQPFIDSNFKLSEMAQQVSLSPHLLSQVINEHFHKNFFEFVNSYRIQMAKEKMKEANWKTQTILGVALDVGYNSKSAFNRAFKKFEGSTPSEYLKSIR